MTLPSPQESASLLIQSIKHLLPASHITVAEILMLASQHIEADRQAHCRHVMQMPVNEIVNTYYLPTAHPTHGAATPGRAAGVIKKGNKQ